MTFRAYVCERIRTLDLLVRSQTLYPAELHTLNVDRGRPRSSGTLSANTKQYYHSPPASSTVKAALVLLLDGLDGVICIFDVRDFDVVFTGHFNEISAQAVNFGRTLCVYVLKC